MKAYELKISLKGAKPPIWRKVIVPSGINFMQLHNVIQIAMGWENCHMYEFDFSKIFDEIVTSDIEACEEYEFLHSDEVKKRFGEKAVLIDIFMHTPKALYAKEVIIDEYLEKAIKFEYIYDFGDCWEHKVELINIIDDYAGQLPIVTKFRKSCPPEDCGGIRGYYNILDILADPSNPNYEEFADWLGDIECMDEYDIDAVNEELECALDMGDIDFYDEDDDDDFYDDDFCDDDDMM